MKEKLHRYLDGELPREELTPEELEEVASYESIIWVTQRISRSIRVPDMTAGVLRRIQAGRLSMIQEG